MKFWSNGVDFPPQSSGEKLEWSTLGLSVPSRRHYLMTSCRLVDGKGLDRALRVIQALVEQGFKDFQYLVVGSGPLLENLKRQAQRSGIEPYVTFVSALPQDEVVKLLSLVDAVVLTYEYSNVGNPLLEAIAARKIIFTLDTDYTKEWVHHGIDGFIFEVDGQTDKAMASQIAKVLPDQLMCQQIRENMTMSNYRKLWSWPDRLEAEVQLVSRLVEDRIV